MTIVPITRHLSVNTDHVVASYIDERHYVNGHAAHLVIRLSTGTEHRIEHTAGYLDGNDIYKIKANLDEAGEKTLREKIAADVAEAINGYVENLDIKHEGSLRSILLEAGDAIGEIILGGKP